MSSERISDAGARRLTAEQDPEPLAPLPRDAAQPHTGAATAPSMSGRLRGLLKLRSALPRSGSAAAPTNVPTNAPASPGTEPPAQDPAAQPAVLRLGADKLAALERARAKQPNTATPTEKKPLLSKLAARPVTLTTGVPGTGRTISRPLRPGIEKAAVPATDADAVVEQAHQLTKLAQAMMQGLQPRSGGMFDWPAPSRTRKVLGAAIPWLRPPPLQDFIRESPDKKPMTAPSEAARPRAEIAASAQALLALVDAHRKEVDDAVAALSRAREKSTRARTRLDTFQADSPEATQDAAAAQSSALLKEAVHGASVAVLDAEQKVRAANRHLSRVINGSDLPELLNLCKINDLAEQSMVFSVERLADLKSRIDTIRGAAYDRRTAIDAQLELRAEEARVLMTADETLAQAKLVEMQSESRLNGLTDLLATLSGATDTSTPAAAGPGAEGETAPLRTRQIAVLQSRIEVEQGVLAHVQLQRQRCEDRIRTREPQFAELNRSISALLEQRTQAQRRLHAADAGTVPFQTATRELTRQQKELVAVLERGSAAQPQPSTRAAGAAAAAVEQVDKAALEALNKSFIAHLVESANGFGPEAAPQLKDALNTLAEKMRRAATPGSIPTLSLLEATARKLAHFTHGDAAQAAEILQTMAQHPMTHWVELAARTPAAPELAAPADAAPADAATQRVLDVCRQVVSLPRGVELLHAWSDAGAQPPDSGAMEALRVFWNADKALVNTPDERVKGWLLGAREVAQSKVLPPEAPRQFDDVGHGAYNAVRNGYVSNAVGSPYDQHNQRMQKAIVEWVIRALCQKAAAAEASMASIAATDTQTDAHAPTAPAVPTVTITPATPVASEPAAISTDTAAAASTPADLAVPIAALSNDTAPKPKPKPSVWRRVNPLLNKTPFGRRGVERSYDVVESLGMKSARTQVDQAVSRRLAALEQAVAACEASGDATLKPLGLAAQAMINHLKQQTKRARHLSQITLKSGDAKDIRQRLSAQVHARRLAGLAVADAAGGADGAARPRPAAVLRKAAPQAMPDFFTALCGHGRTAYEALNLTDEYLRSQLAAQGHAWPEEAAPRPATEASDLAAVADTELPSTLAAKTPIAGIAPADQEFAAAIRLLKSKYFTSHKDILTVLMPIISTPRLRDRIRLGGGGTLGLSLPTLPYGSASPLISPIFTAERSRTDEAVVEYFFPTIGMQISFGSARTQAKEATLGFALGPLLAPDVAVQGTVTARMAVQHTKTESTLMRHLRKSRDKDDQMSALTINALKSMVLWDELEPEQGRAYAGPLEAVFARNPEVVITQSEGVTDTSTVTGRISVRLPFVHFNEAHGIAQTLSLEPSLFVEAERVRDRRTETGGVVQINGDKSDMAQQRTGFGVNANFAPLTNQGILEGHKGSAGEVQRESLPTQLGVTRDLSWTMSRHAISPFLVGEKQDADMDAHDSSPAPILKEIAKDSKNRPLWLMRCIETLPPDSSGEKNTPENRERAEAMLDMFEQEVIRLGKSNHFCQFNVNRSMRGAAGAEIDGYRMLGELARQRGDLEGVRDAQLKIDLVYTRPSTWRELTLTVRERARDATTRGWRSGLRWQRNTNVDGQRTAIQFPPA
jgi:hypothetical protein